MPTSAPVHDDVPQHVWAPILRRAGLRYRKPHALRHTYASLLIEAGESLKYVQEQLGHHSPGFTLSVYGHLIPRVTGERWTGWATKTAQPRRNLGAGATRNPREHRACIRTGTLAGPRRSWQRGGAMLYSRPQLSLLLLLGAALLAGLAVREWRAGFPEAAARLESFDRVEPGAALEPTPLAGPARPSRAPRPPRVPAAPAARARGPGSRREGGAGAGRPASARSQRGQRGAARPAAGRGPGLARRIVEERQRRGRFEGPEGLRSVLGLGPRKLAALRDLVTAAP